MDTLNGAGKLEEDEVRNVLSALVSTRVPCDAGDLVTLVGMGVQLESVTKETGFEEVETAGGYRIRWITDGNGNGEML